MSDFQEMMKRAREQGQDWAPGPGPHTARVVDTDLRFTRTDDIVVGLDLELLDDGPDRGKRWEHPVFFTSEKAREMAAQTLSVYGIPADVWDACTDEEDLRRALDEHVRGRGVEVTVKPRDDGNGVWTNISSSSPADGANGFPADTRDLTDYKPAPKPDSFDDVPY